jgi:branched-chain amino acid aminotransferase
MAECTGAYFSEDITYKEVSLFKTNIFDCGVVLYEVLRIYNETALFLEDHIQRLQESVRLSGYPYIVSVPVIHYLLRNLIRRNGFPNGNVKIVLHFKADCLPVLYTYFIPHVYPTPAMYKDGIETDLFTAVRLNPNVKRLLPEVRQRVSEFIQAENLYDALFVGEDETITEGSKTNVFFIQGESVYTPPGDRVLKGITRGKIIKLCKQLNISLIEQSISINTLHYFNAAFLTGTSPKVLPIRRIANLEYKVINPMMNAIIEAYDDLIASYAEQ